MNIGPFESGVVFFVIFLLYLLPSVFVIYWMIKMLRNSNENLKLSREIHELLKKQNNV